MLLSSFFDECSFYRPLVESWIQFREEMRKSGQSSLIDEEVDEREVFRILDMQKDNPFVKLEFERIWSETCEEDFVVSGRDLEFNMSMLMRSVS